MAALTNDMLMKLSSVEVAELCRKATEIAGHFIYNAENQEASGKRWTIDNWENHIGVWTANHKKQELVQTFLFLNGLVTKKCLRKESIPFIVGEVKEMIEKLEIKDGVADLLQKIEDLDQHCAKSGTALDGLSAKIEGLEGDQLKTELMKVINETKALTSENHTALMKNLDKIFAPNEEALKICKELASKLQIELPTQNPMNEKREWKMKIDKNIQKFNGNLNENWDDWIFQVDNFEKFNEIKETDMLGMVIPLLKGNALTLLKRDLTANPGLLWKEFKPVLEKIYKSVLKDRRLRKELREIKQKTSFSDFCQRFQELCNQIPGIPEDEKVLIFTEALRPNVKCHLMLQKDKRLSLDDAIAEASIFEECHNGSRDQREEVRKVNYVRSNFPRKPRPSYFNKNNGGMANSYNNKSYGNKTFGNKSNFTKPSFNKPGYSHSKYSSYKRPQSDYKKVYAFNTKKKEDLKCFNCNKLGHIAKNCREAKTSKFKRVNQIIPWRKERGEDSGISDAEETEETQTYHRCCAIKNDEFPLLETKVSINGYELIMALDSGASANILSIDSAKRMNLKLLPTNLKIKLANDSIAEALGVTDELSVNICGTACTCIFIVIQHTEHDGLLGLPWFNETGAGLYPKERYIHFPGHKIYLDSEVEGGTHDCLALELLDDDEIAEEMDWGTVVPFTEKKEYTVKPEMELSPMQLKNFIKQ
jgi:hypothetical protein